MVVLEEETKFTLKMQGVILYMGLVMVFVIIPRILTLQFSSGL